MIDRKGVVLHAHLHAARNGQFVGVNLRLHAQLAPGLHDAGRLFHGKEPFVAEDIDEIGQFPGRHGRKHFVADQLHVFLLPADIVPRHGVGAEERGAHGQRSRLADAADDAQHLQFVFGRKTIAALDLDAARSLRGDLALPA